MENKFATKIGFEDLDKNLEKNQPYMKVLDENNNRSINVV